jgi:N-acetylglutamate synthase-like GNAT family acetyltransferase
MITSGPALSGRATFHTTVQQASCAMEHSSTANESITLRITLKPGDIGTIVYLHGILYAREYGFDHMFEVYVAGPLSEFAHRNSERERLWIAERDGQIVGCIAIVAASAEVAQLRWFLVHPDARGAGLGRTLLDASVTFSREQGYRRIILWTVSALEAAAHLYRAVGFRKVGEKPEHEWGTDVVEEKYEMQLM